jgi:tellurite resistance protein TerC
LIEATLWHWLAFSGFVVAMLVLDLGVFHRHSRDTTFREAAIWTCIWASLALCFNGLVWYVGGRHKAVEFLTGYLIEWSLSMDNVFVFAVIFGFFRVPLKYQYRVLFWGIMGAIVMRLTFILIGAEAIRRWEWVVYILGAFLVYTGIKMATHDSEVDPERSLVLRLARRFLPVARGQHGEKFFAIENGKRCITPLFLVLMVVESTDVMFAVDSVPAIFGVTKDPFIVFTSNIFAILGLRALYFLLAGVMDMFRYLKYGLSAILIFVGLKMLAGWFEEPPEWFVDRFGMPAEWVRHWIAHPPPWASLLVVLSLLAISIVVSVVASLRDARRHPPTAVAGVKTDLSEDELAAATGSRKTGTPARSASEGNLRS